MSRNASGTHSLPAGNPVVAGTIADPVAHNATMTDFSTEITDSLSRSGKGGMSAPLVVVAGSVTAPSIAPTGDPNTGIYAPAADELAIATGGTQRLKASSAGVNVTGAMAATGAVSGTTGTFTGALSAASGQINSSDIVTKATAATAAVNGSVTLSAAPASAANPVVLAKAAAGFDAATTKIVNVTDPGAAQDAATKKYVDDNVALASVTITAGTTWTATISSCAKIGGLVCGNIQYQAGASSAWTSIGTLPAGSRPASGRQFIGLLTTAAGPSNSYLFQGGITAAGVISAELYHSGAGGGVLAAMPTIAAGDSVSLHFAFIAA